MEFSTLPVPRGAVLVCSSSLIPVSVSTPVSLSGPGAGPSCRSDREITDLLTELESVPDPRDRRGRRYRLSTLLGIMVCAMTGAGHDSFTAIGEWCQRTARQAPATLARLGVPIDPFTGRLGVPDEK